MTASGKRRTSAEDVDIRVSEPAANKMILVPTPPGLATSTALSIKVKDVSNFFAESKKHAAAQLLNHDKEVTGELR